MHEQLTEYITEHLSDFIARHGEQPLDPSSRNPEFNSLALTLFRLQFQHNPSYARFCTLRNRTPGNTATWQDIPAIPAVAFKELDLTCLPPGERTHVFHSSGTTAQTPSRHFHCPQTLNAYQLSLNAGFKPRLLPHLPPHSPAICLTPPPAQAPHSSLVHMLDSVHLHPEQPRTFTGRLDPSHAWIVDCTTTLSLFHNLLTSQSPALIMGTAFSFVHLLDHMDSNHIRLTLPHGSRVMETGGYKGRSRTLPKPELHRLIQDRLGIPPDFIVCEYGMSELSSQAYDHVAGKTAPSTNQRTFQFPPWARARIVSPENGVEVEEGQTGLLEITDLANVASVLALRTEDLATRRGDGFQLQGRTQQAEPRGCSLMTL